MKRAIAGLGCALLLCGCGGRDATTPDRLRGPDIAAMAESELEAENPELATGSLTCPDLVLDIGASVRCQRSTQLSGGRVVKIRGTVTVSSLEGGGRLHVALDERAEEFGLTGDRVAADVARRYQRRFRARPSAVDCPYLRGVVGTTVTCGVVVAGNRRDVAVRVTAVDPARYRTSYAVTMRATTN